MKAAEIFKQYIWLTETIRRAGNEGTAGKDDGAVWIKGGYFIPDKV